jgi:DNA-binding transcriptional MerR regulator
MKAPAFVRPKHSRKEVAAALQAREVTFQNWQARGQIDLDADEVREGTKWRLYSPRDVLRLGLAVKLTDLGFPASLLRHVMRQLDPLFAEPSPYLVSNRPSFILVLPDGEVIGPTIGPHLDFSSVPARHFIFVRLDTLVRDAFRSLGVR